MYLLEATKLYQTRQRRRHALSEAYVPGVRGRVDAYTCLVSF